MMVTPATFANKNNTDTIIMSKPADVSTDPVITLIVMTHKC